MVEKPNVKDYRIVEDTDKGRFTAEVNRLLGYGYLPIGEMSAETPFNPFLNITTYRQAMLKND